MTCLPHQAAHAAPRVPLTVNGIEVPYDQIAREVQFHPAATPVEAWQAASRALAVREMLLQEATRLGFTPQPVVDSEGARETDEEALVRQVVEQEVVVPQPTKEACRRYYDQNLSRFRTPAIVEASHILFAASPSDAGAFATRREEAKCCIEKLAGNPAGFAKLANDVSACPSAAQGGSLGQLSPGQTTPAFEAALADMSPGEMSSEPVESPYGFHVIHLMRRIEGCQLPFEAVEARIARYLSDKVSRTATAQYLARLAAAGCVAGVDLPNAQDMRVF